MPATDGDLGPFADTIERIAQIKQSHLAQAAERTKRGQLRQAAIDQFVADHPVPALLLDVEARAWSSAVEYAARALFPMNAEDAADFDALDYMGISDSTGVTFQRRCHQYVTDLARNEILVSDYLKTGMMAASPAE
jgi:hypothetical protein